MMKLVVKQRTLVSILFLLFVGMHDSFAQQAVNPLPQLIQKEGRYALMVDGAPYLILGGQSHNSSTWPAMLPQVWETMRYMHANTLEIPVYWEQFEPREGQFDYSMVQLVLDQARQQNKRVVLLWFATWKNGSNHYMPSWMKLNAKKYPNVIGKDGKPVDSPSPHFTATRDADAKAFRELMSFLKRADPQHTVIMVQVENEPGTWGSVRDYSKTAQKLFEQQVPDKLLTPAVLKELNVNVKAKGTWSEVFGERADEYFHAWSVASFINYVAQAGKEVNPLPLYVNVALRDPLLNQTADHYESGGATDNVICIWKAAAPAIDLVAPDIYLQGDERYLKVLELYDRPDNVLFVPETTGNAKYIYEVIKRGIGFSPFGVDPVNGNSQQRNEAVAEEYKVLNPMMRDLAQWAFEGRIYSVVEMEGRQEASLNLGAWEGIVIWGNSRNPSADKDRPDNGKAMLIQLGENEFMAVGTDCRFTFKPLGKNKGKAWQYITVEEGYYQDGAFTRTRVLNGDETDWGGPYVGSKPKLLRVVLTARD